MPGASRHAARTLLPPLLGLLLAAGSLAFAEDAAPPPEADPAAEVAASLAALDAPFLVDREAAVESLIAGLPDSRDAVVAEFRAARGPRQALLARVLAADGSPASLDALLRALPGTTDPATAGAIRMSLVEHAERVAEAVAAWRDANGDVPAAVAELGTLLRRARVESLFLARKSRSGLTGSYPGQFDSLRPDRRLALDVCLGILLDRRVKLPGQFPSGSYRWLRPPSIVIEKIELRYMALHALAELAGPDDADVTEALEGLHAELDDLVGHKGRFEARIEAGLLDNVTTALARLRPDPWAERAEQQILLLSRGDTTDDAAAMCMRLGQYRRAVQLFRSLQRLQRIQQIGDRATVSYNLACAYARWAQETTEETDANELRSLSLEALERAHADGYSDWSWMEQDRDLDAVRADPRYAALVAGMRAEFAPPAPAAPAGEAPRPPR